MTNHYYHIIMGTLIFFSRNTQEMKAVFRIPSCTEFQIKKEVDGRATAIKLLGGKVRFTGQNGQSDNSEAKFKEVPISSETNDNIHALSNHAKICSP